MRWGATAAFALLFAAPALGGPAKDDALVRFAGTMETLSLRPIDIERARPALIAALYPADTTRTGELAGCAGSRPAVSLKVLVGLLLECDASPGDVEQSRQARLGRALVALTEFPGDSYYDANDLARLLDVEKGGFIGLGFSEADGRLVVARIFRGGAAEKAGIGTGWTITSLAGKPYVPGTLGKTRDLLRGPVGSTLQIRLVDKSGASHHFDLERLPYSEIEPAFNVVRDGDTLRIALFAFDQGLAARMADLVETKGKGVRHVVFDLTGNGGGTLDDAVAAADLFLSRGTIASLRGRNGIEEVFRADKADILRGAAMTVVVDGETALGAELFAAALVDNDRASLVGTPTLGKGNVRTFVPVGRDAAAAFVTAEILRPNGQPLEGQPLVPARASSIEEPAPLG